MKHLIKNDFMTCKYIEEWANHNSLFRSHDHEDWIRFDQVLGLEDVLIRYLFSEAK